MPPQFQKPNIPPALANLQNLQLKPVDPDPEYARDWQSADIEAPPMFGNSYNYENLTEPPKLKPPSISMPKMDDLVQRGAPPGMAAMPAHGPMPALQNTAYTAPNVTPNSDADFNQRADNIIRGTKAPGAFDSTPTPPATSPVAGLQAALPGKMSWSGDASAQAMPRPSAQEAASTLTGGQGGALGSARMSPDLQQFQNLLNMRKPGGTAQDEAFINQALEREMAGSAAKSASLEEEREKTRREGLEEEKLRQPFEMEKYKLGTVPAAQTAQQEFLKGQQERQFQQQQQMQQQLLEQNPLLHMLNSGVDPYTAQTMLHSYNPKTGATTLNPLQKTPAGLETEATKVAQNLAKAGTQAHFWGGGPTKELEAANQNAMSRLNYLNVDPKIKNYIQQAISSHPQGIATPFEQAFDLSEADPGVAQQLQQVWNHLLAGRGQ